jgi:hypothetical protein
LWYFAETSFGEVFIFGLFLTPDTPNKKAVAKRAFGIAHRSSDHILANQKINNSSADPKCVKAYEISGDSSAKQDKVKKSWKGSDLVRPHLFAQAFRISQLTHYPLSLGHS